MAVIAKTSGWRMAGCAGVLAAALAGCKSTSQSLYDLRTEGDVQYRGNRYELAERAYAKYIEIEPGNHEMRYALGKTLVKLNRPSEAAEHLRVAYSQRPNRGEYADALVEAMVASNQRDELFRLLRANANDRNTTEDWMRLGRAALAMGDSDTAQTALLTAARIDKGRSHEPQLGLCDLYRSIGKRDQAIRRLRMAYYLAPLNSDVLLRGRQLELKLEPGVGLVPEEFEAAR
jgi:tetratricopeptide (TPR) repeat protein